MESAERGGDKKVVKELESKYHSDKKESKSPQGSGDEDDQQESKSPQGSGDENDLKGDKSFAEEDDDSDADDEFGTLDRVEIHVSI